MPSNHLILCCPLLLPPSIFPSIRVFSNESVLHIRWLKYCNSASTSVPPMNIQDWFLLGWTVWISLQSKGLSRVFYNMIVQKHQFLSIQLSHLYMTTGKTIALTRWTCVGKVMSLLFNMLSRLVTAFLARRRCLLSQGTPLLFLSPAPGNLTSTWTLVLLLAWEGDELESAKLGLWEPVVCIFSQLFVQWLQPSILGLATVGILTLGTLENVVNVESLCFCRELVGLGNFSS